ncbi:hypothetical protein EOA60_04555 [Mesorhizobium sp. M1A.F.Ca.IN.020.06.1.1]|uniref:hypothetical protein n=1 Tax=unclassified Mesorhizobium TaxID=325217 RepID=UPI000FCB846C|nr:MULTISPECIES: hypothetical protein [unclassified Mesorhizobium]RUV84333.1 hypothetical protein EOA51_22185 [Mesorhizobium sp. M1A.F.Ca.IN.020.32.1.1]RUW13870.1 hypothetical protein EOA46_05245 [Mesorhizobium sp. M1A.F.Ca.IN.022.05.2.1]RUW35435.1 hypothetical protein EOA60_04555 [Mesorhizobium sp. M1A.F.Ca.IN.020.06.1.1]RWF81333.1 MAG: hypothetical protein EOQ35_14330 [Mesorhizobium sp.]RWG06173.1 MAG: hypothetical protein EOQ38_02030 [Mesorhizobium sp.]
MSTTPNNGAAAPMTTEQSLAIFEKVGGPAFPAEWTLPDNSQITCPGMTLQDWFAGQAIAGMFAVCERDERDWPDAANLAANAYRYANAMLAERAKAGGQ